MRANGISFLGLRYVPQMSACLACLPGFGCEVRTRYFYSEQGSDRSIRGTSKYRHVQLRSTVPCSHRRINGSMRLIVSDLDRRYCEELRKSRKAARL